MEEYRIIELPKIADPRGNLSFLEGKNHVPFEIKRTYWIYDVPGGESRGGHAYRELEEFIVALSGSFNVELDNGTEAETITLNRGYFGLYLPKLVWREINCFSTNAVALIMASLPYSEDDYIRDFDNYLRIKRE